jgi:WD domain, G-beta repeat
MKRTWSSTAPQLETLLLSTQSTGAALAGALPGPQNHVQASAEILRQALLNPENGGRTLQDAIVVSESNSNHRNATVVDDLSKEVALTRLQAPVYFPQKTNVREEETPSAEDDNFVVDNELVLPLRSSTQEFSKVSSESMRQYWQSRSKCSEDEANLATLQRSLEYQRTALAKVRGERSDLLAKSKTTGGGADATALMMQLDEINAAEQNCERAIAHLDRQLPTLLRAQEFNRLELDRLQKKAMSDYANTKSVLHSYNDPVQWASQPTFFNNRLLRNVVSCRQGGLDRFTGRTTPRSMGRIRASGALTETRKAVLHNRFSHAATINTHLSYPVYCLRFDRTGRYFISGADDYLVKVFCMGGSIPVKETNRRLEQTSFMRGAVLVCTLKGHAGVINDIGVSSDNSLLATASEDGDCRVWGLKDGCPVAILRGHTGGANMVRSVQSVLHHVFLQLN